MGIGSAIGAAVSIGSGILGSKAAKKAGKKSAEAREAAAEQVIEGRDAALERTDASRERVAGLLNPFVKAGSDATNFLGDILLGRVDPSEAVEASPGFQFRREQGERGLLRGQRARGLSISGRGMEELLGFNSGLASQEFDAFLRRLFGLSESGRGAATSQAGIDANLATGAGNIITNAGANVGNFLAGAGDARAQGILNSTAALTSGIAGAVNPFLAIQSENEVLGRLGFK